jgi:hypothetical protein
LNEKLNYSPQYQN